MCSMRAVQSRNSTIFASVAAGRRTSATTLPGNYSGDSAHKWQCGDVFSKRFSTTLPYGQFKQWGMHMLWEDGNLQRVSVWSTAEKSYPRQQAVAAGRNNSQGYLILKASFVTQCKSFSCPWLQADGCRNNEIKKLVQKVQSSSHSCRHIKDLLARDKAWHGYHVVLDASHFHPWP